MATKKLITANDMKPLMMTAMAFLHRAEICILTAATGDEILRLHITEDANLIVTKVDLPGLACETLIHTIRRSESMRAVSIILLCREEPAERERSRRCGANAVVIVPVDTASFASTIQKLLDVAPRRGYRVVLNVSVDGRRNNRPFLGNSQNISTKGILIRSAEKLDQGDHIVCSFFLPDGKRISTDGEIVRIAADPEAKPGVRCYGVRFLSLSPDAELAIAAFVDTEQQQTREAGFPGSKAVA